MIVDADGVIEFPIRVASCGRFRVEFYEGGRQRLRYCGEEITDSRAERFAREKLKQLEAQLQTQGD